MTVRSALTVGLTGVGLASGERGPVVTLPRVAFATWQGYRQTVGG